MLAGGASLLTLAVPGDRAGAAGKVDALLLTCMDYRLLDDTARYMNERGLRGRYDQVILAGASLGAVTSKYPAWNETFWQHLDLAIQLHGVHQVIVMDHRDCGAYRLILGEDLSTDAAREKAVHAKYLDELRRQIRARHADLQVELLLINLKGAVEKIV